VVSLGLKAGKPASRGPGFWRLALRSRVTEGYSRAPVAATRFALKADDSEY